MPLIRITCPATRTDQIVEILRTQASATDVSVIPGASRTTGGDLILAEVPRAAVDTIVERLPGADLEGIHLSVQSSERLVPAPGTSADDDAVVWAQVVQDVHETGRLSWINVQLVFNVASQLVAGTITLALRRAIGRWGARRRATAEAEVSG